MLSGRRLDLLDPSPLDIEIEDIAHGLSREARWNGQTAGAWAYSVAQHSVVVADLVVRLRPSASPAWRLAALLHDAPEYVIGDLITPFKAAIGLDYRAFERKLHSVIHIRFGLAPAPSPTLEQLIKRADRAAAYWEAVELAGFTEDEASRIFRRPAGIGPLQLGPWSPEHAKQRFLERFDVLHGKE